MNIMSVDAKISTRQVVLQVFRPLLDEEAVFLIKRMGFRV